MEMQGPVTGLYTHIFGQLVSYLSVLIIPSDTVAIHTLLNNCKIMAVQMWKHPHPVDTNLNAFRLRLNRKHSLNLNTFKEIHDWSIADTEAFSAAIWEFCGIKYSVPPTRVANGLDTMYPPPEWFPGARLNYTENLLAAGLALRPDGLAVTALREGGELRELTFKQLEEQVAVWANTLRKMGVSVGDRVVGEVILLPFSFQIPMITI